MISDRAIRRLVGSDERAALLGDLIRGIIAALLIIICVVLLMYYAALANVMFTKIFMNDFGKFYYSARAFLDSGDMYAATPATATPITDRLTVEFANMNPPHFHLLLMPIARLPPLAALLVWAGASAAALVMSLKIIASEVSLRWTPTGLFWTIAGVISCAATGIIIVTGQVSFLLMLPLTLAWRAARHDRWIRSAVYLGILASIKPFLAILILLFVFRRKLPAAIVMIATSAACFGLGILIFGWNNTVSWLHALRGVTWAWAPMNGSIEGLLTRVFSETPVFAPVVDSPHAVKLGSLLAAIGLLVSCAVAVKRDRSPESVDRAFALLPVVALLVSPLGWIYYVWIIAGPLAAIWLHRRARRRGRVESVFAAIAIAGLLTPYFVTVMLRPSIWAGITFGSVYAWTMLALWVALMLDWKARRQTA